MDIIDTEKIMMSEHGGLPRCNKTTCISADMEFVEYYTKISIKTEKLKIFT